eukprot:1269778-Alexandrium_andersonii.AAC.1
MHRVMCATDAATSAAMELSGTSLPLGARRTVSPGSAPNCSAARVLARAIGSVLASRTCSARVPLGAQMKKASRTDP